MLYNHPGSKEDIKEEAMSCKPASSVSEENRNLKRAGWGCVVGCGQLGGSITPLACNTANLSALAGSQASLANQPSHIFSRQWSEGEGQEKNTVQTRGGTTHVPHHTSITICNAIDCKCN